MKETESGFPLSLPPGFLYPREFFSLSFRSFIARCPSPLPLPEGMPTMIRRPYGEYVQFGMVDIEEVIGIVGLGKDDFGNWDVAIVPPYGSTLIIEERFRQNFDFLDSLIVFLADRRVLATICGSPFAGTEARMNIDYSRPHEQGVELKHQTQRPGIMQQITLPVFPETWVASLVEAMVQSFAEANL